MPRFLLKTLYLLSKNTRAKKKAARPALCYFPPYIGLLFPPYFISEQLCAIIDILCAAFACKEYMWLALIDKRSRLSSAVKFTSITPYFKCKEKFEFWNYFYLQ